RLSFEKIAPTLDHSSVNEWLGDLSSDNFEIKYIWNYGYDSAREILINFGYTEEDFELQNENITMLNPFGKDLVFDDLNTHSDNEIFEETADDDLQDYLLFDENPSNCFVELEGGRVHKANAVNSVLNNNTKLSNDRVIRVRSQIESLTVTDDMEDLETVVRLTDTLITPIKYKDGSYGAVIISITRIVYNDKLCPFFIHSNFNEAEFTGNILKIEKKEDDYFIWKGNYGQSIKTDGQFSSILSLKIIDQSRNILGFSTEQIKDGLNLLEGFVNLSSLQLSKIDCPYKEDIVPDFTLQNLESNKLESIKLNCKICDSLVLLEKMRIHVGQHILKNDSVGEHICGYCGKLGCIIRLKKSSGRGKSTVFGPDSDCKFFVKFSLKAASKVSKNYPCTNRPIECIICKAVYWSYNIAIHYKEKHPHIAPPLSICDEEKIEVLNYKL
ncbi:unnamed protein product, partial [Brachionus calyciflorus]